MLLKGVLMVDIKGIVNRNKKVGIAFIAGIALVLVVLAHLPNGASPAQTQGGSGTLGLLQQDIGSTAPDFILQGVNGSAVKLSDYRGKTVVLFFSEGEMCYPACWSQMAALATDPRFNNNNVVAFSIVTDSRDPWIAVLNNATALQKNNMTGLDKAKLLFDADRSVSTTYNVFNLPSSMHPGQDPGHTLFVIDKNGVIRSTLDDPSMNVDNEKLAAALSAI